MSTPITAAQAIALLRQIQTSFNNATGNFHEVALDDRFAPIIALLETLTAPADAEVQFDPGLLRVLTRVAAGEVDPDADEVIPEFSAGPTSCKHILAVYNSLATALRAERANGVERQTERNACEDRAIHTDQRINEAEVTPLTDASIKTVDVAFVGHDGLSSSPEQYAEPDFARGLERALRAERAKGKTVPTIKDTPALDWFCQTARNYGPNCETTVSGFDAMRMVAEIDSLVVAGKRKGAQ